MEHEDIYDVKSLTKNDNSLRFDMTGTPVKWIDVVHVQIMKEYPKNIYIKYHSDENFIPALIKCGKKTKGHKKINPLNSKLQSAYTS